MVSNCRRGYKGRRVARGTWRHETDLCDAVLLSEVRVKSILRRRQGVTSVKVQSGTTKGFVVRMNGMVACACEGGKKWLVSAAF